MKNKFDDLIKDTLDEMGDPDPITLTNQILNHSMHTHGFDWTSQAGKQISVEKIFDNAPLEVDMVGDFKRDLEEAEQATEQPQEAPQEAEVNSTDPSVQSTDPGFNMCPGYLNGVCRVNGKPCVFSNADYKDCGIYTLAKSGIPTLFEIPPGKENDMSYIHGIKDS